MHLTVINKNAHSTHHTQNHSPAVVASSIAVSNTCPQAHGNSSVVDDVTNNVPADASISFLSGFAISSKRLRISEFIDLSPLELLSSGTLLSLPLVNDDAGTEEDNEDAMIFRSAL